MYIENGKTVRKMPVKLGDGQTIWADCVDLNQKDSNNTMVMEFDNNLNNSNDGLTQDQNNSVMNQQNRPMQQNMVSKNLKNTIYFKKNHKRSHVFIAILFYFFRALCQSIILTKRLKIFQKMKEKPL